MPRLFKNYIVYVVFSLTLLNAGNILNAFSSYSLHGHDAYPMFSTADPHEFLYRYERQKLKGLLDDEEEEDEDCKWGPQRIGFAISAFGQNSDRGRSIRNESVFLGDLGGRWSMIGMLYDETPEGKELGPALTSAKNELFPTLGGAPLTDPSYIDIARQFGYFSIPLVYRKRGARFEVLLQIIKDFGLQIQFGVADICQVVDDPCSEVPNVCDAANNNYTFGFINLTNDAGAESEFKGLDGTTITKSQVNLNLMQQIKLIADEIGLNICDWSRCSVEDVRFNFYWRHAFEANMNCTTWPPFLLIPFFSVGFTAAAGDRKNPSVAFALPFGNNEHNAVGFKGGLNVDFTETVEAGFEFAISHFFSKEFCDFFVPNSEFQAGIFPFKTKVKVRPGRNCHFGLKMSAYHFLNRLSFYFQYLYVSHKKDKITLCKCDDAFKPEVLEKRSCWKTQMANIGFNYDISPNISLGFLWQAPLSQRNAYRSSTVMFSFIATY